MASAFLCPLPPVFFTFRHGRVQKLSTKALSILIKNHKDPLNNYITIAERKICSGVFSKKHVDISEPHNAISVTANFSQSRLISKFSCAFEVKYKQGIFAVIQSMNLRRSVMTGRCQDYIQLKGKKEPSKRFCGSHSVNEATDQAGHHLHLDSDLADNAFFEPGDELDVHIVIHPFLDEPVPDFHIVFTPVLPCRSQTDNVHCDHKKCISKIFHHDRIVNCPYTTCADEEGCPVRSWETFPRKGLGTKVTLSAIAVLIVAFLLFLFAIWVLRRCYCQPTRRRTPLQQGSNAEAGLVMRPVAGATTSDPDLPPSAPPITSAEDKDPPPSYESLFPAR